jgi:ABC-type Mn2+/Zn2+ transport system permease subunit
LDALEEALFGDISRVGILEAAIAVLVSIAVVALTKLIYRQIVLGLISEELATSKGISVARTNLLYLLLISLTVTIGIQITGTLLVGFLVVTPAAAAKIMSANMSKYITMSSVFGAISAISGILLSSYLNVVPGPLVVIAGIIIFIIAIISKWRSKVKS